MMNGFVVYNLPPKSKLQHTSGGPFKTSNKLLITEPVIMIMLMECYYISEMQPPTGIPQVIYEHGEPWWNDDVNRGKLQTHPPELSGSLTTVIW
jgi:hypothetical protein